MSYLTCLGTVLSRRLTLSTEIRPQPRLYSLLLGQSADERKSTSLEKTIEPGERGSQKINLTAPATPGVYILEFDMKDIGISWFSDTGSETVKIMLRIV